MREWATILDFGCLASFFSEKGSPRGVLVDDTAAIYSTNRYRLDMWCARAIDDTAVKNL